MATPDDTTPESIVPEPDAEIILEVTKFTNIFTAEGSGETRGVEHTMKMKKPHPKVKIDPDDEETLLVKPPGGRLVFEISPPEYFPIGISFKLLSGITDPTPEQRLGLHNFTRMKLEPEKHVLIIKDEFEDHDYNDHYEFSITIQRGSDGELGVMDPGFRHQPI